MALGLIQASKLWLITVTNMTMTKKDYELIATSLRTVYENSQGMDTYTYETLVTRLANGLTATNPQFDLNRFLTACGVDSVNPFEGIQGYVVE